MQLWNRAWLYFLQKEEQPEEPVIEWITDVETVRGNNFIIDNKNKIITIYKKYASNGTTLYNMDFLPVAMEGYTPIKPDNLTIVSSVYWRQSTARSKDDEGNFVTNELTFDIMKEGTTEVVATYTLILDWTTTGEV